METDSVTGPSLPSPVLRAAEYCSSSSGRCHPEWRDQGLLLADLWCLDRKRGSGRGADQMVQLWVRQYFPGEIYSDPGRERLYCQVGFLCLPERLWIPGKTLEGWQAECRYRCEPFPNGSEGDCGRRGDEGAGGLPEELRLWLFPGILFCEAYAAGGVWDIIG